MFPRLETIVATLITGFSHTLSTILIGVIVGFVGIKLSESYSSVIRIAAPSILLLIGVIYLLSDLRSSRHHHHFDISKESLKTKRTKTAIIFTLCIGLFFSPCIEIEAYYFQAATQGWKGILIVSLVYLIMTLTIMVSLVYLGLKGVNKFNLHFLDHHEKSITGIVLILLGLLAYFVEF